MGLSTCGRVFLVAVNIFFLVLGVIFFGGGLFLRFGKQYTEQYTQSAEDTLKKLIQDLGGDNSGIDLDMDKLLLSVSLAFIFIGLFLLIVAFLGCVGACCKIKVVVTLYLIVCLVILVAEVVCVILVYGTKTLQGTIKDALKSDIKKSYAGLDGSDITSLAWNIIHILGKCCGVNNYADFKVTDSWDHKETAGGIAKIVSTPVSCCIQLPKTSDVSCAETPTATNNYMNVGCFDKIWGSSLGKVAYAVGVLGGIGALQLLLIVSALCVLCAPDKNKVGHLGGGSRERPRNNQVVPSIPGMKKGSQKY